MMLKQSIIGDIMYFYTIYGLNICSNSIIDIAQQTSPQQKVDVYIDVKYTSELSTKEYISIEEVDNESYIISMPNIARYIITENKISCCSNSYESFISTLFNMPFSILLLLRNEVLLHVSSLASKQGLILISGCKGKGKSTLTAMLSNTNSFEFFADDTIRVNKDSNGYGAHSYIKLYPSMVEKLNLKNSGRYNLAGKLYTTLDNNISNRKIRSLILLNRGNNLNMLKCKESLKIKYLTCIVGIEYMNQSLLKRIIPKTSIFEKMYNLTIPNSIEELLCAIPSIEELIEENI